jgi:DNA-binding MarR family transcriptional regulator
VLGALEGGPARTQAVLAQAIGADKTRIIPVLDELQRGGLIAREPDPADRRARLLSITPGGRRLRAAVQQEIQANEDRVLTALPAADRAAFLRAVRSLSDLPRAQAPGEPAAPPA